MPRYSRYVAIGDSQTEGLWDGDDSAARRLRRSARAIVDAHYPGVTYANLAVRGRRIRDLLDEQLPAALAMLRIGLRLHRDERRDAPGPYFGGALAELDDLHTHWHPPGNRPDHHVPGHREDPSDRTGHRVTRLQINDEIRRAAD